MVIDTSKIRPELAVETDQDIQQQQQTLFVEARARRDRIASNNSGVDDPAKQSFPAAVSMTSGRVDG